jgi:hypothetical protein
MKKNTIDSESLNLLSIPRYKVNDDGELVYMGDFLNSNLIAGLHLGETWIDKIEDTDIQVKFFRSIKGNDMVDWEKPYHDSYSSADSFNDLVEIILPEDATPEDIAQAMREFGGVEDVRHATMADIRVIAENKILALFAPKPTDGSRNVTGAIRQELLDNIKERYGVSPDIVEVVPTSDGLGYELLLPEDVAMNLAKMAKIRGFSHELASYGKTQSVVRKLLSKGLKGTTSRWFNGVLTKGQSSSTDITRAGGDAAYTWTMFGDPETKSYVANGRVFVPASQGLRRLDWWVNKGDGWGKKISSANEMSYFEYLTALGLAGGANEVLFKGGIPWDLIGNIGSSDPQEVASELAARGITMIGGRSVKELLGIA